MKPKWSDPKSGQNKFGGWNNEGKERFSALIDMVKRVRKVPQEASPNFDTWLAEIERVQALEKLCMEELGPLNHIKPKNTKKNKSKDEDEEEFEVDMGFEDSDDETVWDGGEA